MSEARTDTPPDSRPMSAISSVSQHVHFLPPSSASAERATPGTYNPSHGYPDSDPSTTGLYPANGYPQHGYPLSQPLQSSLPRNPYPTNLPPRSPYPLDRLPDSSYPSQKLPDSPFPPDRLPENLYPASPPPKTRGGDEHEVLEPDPPQECTDLPSSI